MRIGILGSTGAVGKEMLSILEERNLPVKELRLFASKRSAGKVFTFHQKQIAVEEANESSFEGLDAVLGAVDAKISRRFAPWILQSKAIYIDNSSAFRLDEKVPLVVPEINPEDIESTQGIISNPNCVTIIGLLAASVIHRHFPVKKITMSSYQAVSGAGLKGMEELRNQIHCSGEKEKQLEVFSHPIAYNVIPCIGEINENGFTSEEMKFQNESRKILHHPKLQVSCTCVRVPVERSHSLAMTIECEKEVSIDNVKREFEQSSGIRYVDDIVTPLHSSNQDDVLVCRLRHDLNDKRIVLMWSCGDQLRKGAALNAVEILELWAKKKLMLLQ
ncbi:MAG: aspartate-semialdehyde dehydrogenase [Erysipelotrichaceae bacterium]|nr:aspartate-semialdehyde dehydrogenase [Erysipelotrichaceae bacterium]